MIYFCVAELGSLGNTLILAVRVKTMMIGTAMTTKLVYILAAGIGSVVNASGIM